MPTPSRATETTRTKQAAKLPVRYRKEKPVGRYVWYGPRRIPRFARGVPRAPGAYLALSNGHNLPEGPLLPGRLPFSGGASGPLIGPLNGMKPYEDSLWVWFATDEAAQPYHGFLDFLHTGPLSARIPFLPGTGYLVLGGVLWREWSLHTDQNLR